MRLAFNELWYRERSSGTFCTGTSPAMSCVDPSSRYTHFQIGEASVFLLPYATRRTRLEIGGGFVLTDPGTFATVAASRRLFEAAPVWVAIGWQPRTWLYNDLADGTRPMRPTHSFRLGVEFSR